jgi:hypothetical protein
MKKFLLLLFIPLGCYAQALPNSVVLNASPPQVMNANQIFVAITGGSTGTTVTRSIWVAVNYPIGSPGLSGPYTYQEPFPLSVTNYVTISWPCQSGAVSYDVLKTKPGEPTPNPQGTYTYALRTGVTACSLLDQGITRTSYTVETPVPTAQCSIILDNKDASTPYLYTTPCLYNNVFALTLTTTGTSGAATYSNGTLNIPIYSNAGGGTISFQNTPTTTAIVTDYNSTQIQTPCATCTLSSSGNLGILGSMSVGVGIGSAGYVQFGDTSATTLFATVGSPTTYTGGSYTLFWPVGPGTAFYTLSLDSSGVQMIWEPIFQRIVAPIVLTAQTATIGATSIISTSGTAETFRTCYTLLAEATGTAGQVTAHLSWTENSINRTITSASVTLGSGSSATTDCILTPLDATATLAYSTTVTSGGGGSTYNLYITTEIQR